MVAWDGRLKGCDRCAAPPGEELCRRAGEALSTKAVHGSYNTERRRTCVVFPGLNRAIQVSDGSPSANIDLLELTLQLELLSVPSRGKVGILRIKEIPEFSGLNLKPLSRFGEAKCAVALREAGEEFNLEVSADRLLTEHSFRGQLTVSREPVTHPDQFTRQATITLRGEVPDQIRNLLDPTSLIPGRDPLTFRVEVPVNSASRFQDED